MPLKVAVVYNDPDPDRYHAMGEDKAVLGVMDEVNAAYKALVELGYSTLLLPLRPPVERVRETLEGLHVDLVFNLFEGFAGRPETEAQVAYIIAGLGLPCTGCSGAALALALDKAKTKALLEAHGIGTPRYQILSPATLTEFHLTYPCIVKPHNEDASHGLTAKSVVHDMASLEEQVLRVSSLYNGKALVEEFLDDREFNITVLGNGYPIALAISEIVYSLPPGMPRILTFEAKWEPDTEYYNKTQTICPADVSEELREDISRTAMAAFRLVGCRGYARVDFRTDKAGKAKVLEVNPNPDISPDMGAARQAENCGIPYNQFIEKIVELALEMEPVGAKN